MNDNPEPSGVSLIGQTTRVMIPESDATRAAQAEAFDHLCDALAVLAASTGRAEEYVARRIEMARELMRAATRVM